MSEPPKAPETRFLLLAVPTTPLDRLIFGGKPFVIAEGPRSPFESVTLASDQEVGLFARAAFPRLLPPETP